MKKIKVVIVDDESRARKFLSSLLTDYVGDIEVIGMAESVVEAKKVIDQTNPEIVFLDVQMPGGNGFTLLDEYPNPKFDVVFTTAFDKYAIDAIKKSALDYIMKPISIEELKETINKYRNKKETESGLPEETFLIPDFVDSGKQDVKIAIPNVKGFDLVKVKDILYCKADSNYSSFVLEDGNSYIASHTLKYFEEILNTYGFLRIHDSYFVNLSKITKYVRGRGGSVIMSDGAEIPVSRSRKDDLIEFFK